MSQGSTTRATRLRTSIRTRWPSRERDDPVAVAVVFLWRRRDRSEFAHEVIGQFVLREVFEVERHVPEACSGRRGARSCCTG